MAHGRLRLCRGRAGPVSYTHLDVYKRQQYDLPHPKTRTVTADEVKAGAYRDLPFSYPVAMKPANSVEWLNIDFEGRRKAYICLLYTSRCV